MSGKDYGGKVTVRLSTGETFTLRAHAKHSPSGISAQSIVNQDSSLDRTVELKAKRFEFEFADRGLDYEKLMKADRFDITHVEEFTGVTHMYNRAFMVGEPTVDRATGAVTGLSGEAETYIRKGD